MYAISVYDLFNTDTLRNRSTAQKLLNKIKHSNTDIVNLDFKEIRFMSRSFTNELLEGIRSIPKKVELLNLSEDIQKMEKVALIKPKMNMAKVSIIAI